MAIAEENNRRSFSSRRERNLLLVAQVRVGWPKSNDLQEAVRELRTAYPAGSAIMNVVAGREGASVRAAWARLASMFLSAGTNEDARHLGTVHLFEPVGLGALRLRLIFRVVERRGGDFSRHRNKIVSSVDEAVELLASRLADGPVEWNRDELRDAVGSFVRDNPLPSRMPS